LHVFNVGERAGIIAGEDLGGRYCELLIW